MGWAEGPVSMSTRHSQLCRMVPAPVCGVGSSQQQLPVLVACVLGGGCETRGADSACPVPFLLYDSSWESSPGCWEPSPGREQHQSEWWLQAQLHTLLEARWELSKKGRFRALLLILSNNSSSLSLLGGNCLGTVSPQEPDGSSKSLVWAKLCVAGARLERLTTDLSLGG